VVVEFIGDAIVVMFGAPLSAEDDAQRAVACALAMQVAMPELNARNALLGLAELAMGVGVHTGEAIVGNIGSHRRMKYDVIGHTVNLTSRIEGYSVGGQVLISAQTLAACAGLVPVAGEFQAQPKGVQAPIMIYRVDTIGAPFSVSLVAAAEHDAPWFELESPLAIEFSMLDGKQISGPRYQGKLVRLSARGAWIQATRGFRAMTQLQCLLCRTDGVPMAEVVYARVVGQPSREPIILELAFSTLPQELRALLSQAQA
jgi:adenylate cyclase